MKKVLTLATAGLTASLISLTAFGWWGKDSRQEYLVEKVTKELSLTTEQQSSFGEVASAFIDAMETQHDQRRDMHDAREAEAEAFWNRENLVAEDVVNFVKSQRSAGVATMEQNFKPALDKLVAFHATLNEEQRADFAKLVAERMPYMMRGRGGRYHKRGYDRDDDRYYKKGYKRGHDRYDDRDYDHDDD